VRRNGFFTPAIAILRGSRIKLSRIQLTSRGTHLHDFFWKKAGYQRVPRLNYSSRSSRINAMDQERVLWFSLELDPAFEDFNFSRDWDPTMRYGPTSSELYRFVQICRKGSQIAGDEFADTMYWTLREAAFDAFQRSHGARAITYREWFYHKLFQFFRILLFTKAHVAGDSDLYWVDSAEILEKGAIVIGCEGALVQPDELQDSLGPADNNCRLWCDLVETVSASSNERLAVAQAWLRSQRAPDTNSAEPSGWAKNQERDQIIMNSLERGMKPELICQELDKRTIRTLPALEAKGIHRWIDGWVDLEARNSIQQLLRKMPRRAMGVKPLPISN
jgi:hypothetical protein